MVDKRNLLLLLLFLIKVTLISTSYSNEFVSYVGWLDMLTTQGPNANNTHLDPSATGQLYIFALEENTTVSVYYTREVGQSINTPSLIQNHLLEQRGDFVTWFNDISRRGFYDAGIMGNMFLRVVSDKPIIWEMSQRHGYRYVFNCDFQYTVLSLNGSYRGREFYTGIVRTTDGTNEMAKFSVYNPSESGRTVSFWRWDTVGGAFSIAEGSITIPPGEITLFEPLNEGTYHIVSNGDIFLTKGRGYPGASDNNDWFHFAMDWGNGTKIGRELYGQYGGDWSGNKIMIYAYHDLSYQLQIKSFPKDTLGAPIFGSSTTDPWRTIHTGTLLQHQSMVFSPQTPDSANVLFHWETGGDRTGGFFRVLATAPAMAAGGADFFMRGWNQGEILYDKFTYIPEGRFFPFFIPFQQQPGLNNFLWDGPSLVVIAPNASTEIVLYRDGVVFDTRTTTNAHEAMVWNSLGNNHHYEVVASNFVFASIQAEGGYEKAFGLSQATVSRIIHTTIATNRDTVPIGETFEVTIDWEIEDRGTGNTQVEISFEIPYGFRMVESQVGGYRIEENRVIWDLGENSPGAIGRISFTLSVEPQAQQNYNHLLVGGGRLPEFMQRPNNSSTTIFVPGITEEIIPGIVSIVLSSDRQSVMPGELITFRISWSMENRTHPPTNLELSIALPDGFDFISSSRQPSSLQQGITSWILPNRLPGSGGIIEVFAMVSPNITTQINSYTITAQGILPDFMAHTHNSQISVAITFPVEPPVIIELSANRTIALLNDTIAITASATQFNLPFTADSIRVTLPELLFNNGQLRVFIFPREDGAGLIELSPADTFSIHTEATFLVTSQVPGNFVFNVSPHRPNTITSPAGGLQLVFVDRVREIFITWSPTDYTDLADSSRIIPTLARSFTLYLWALQESGEYIRIPGEWIVAEDSSQIFQNFTFATADSAIFTLSRGRGGKVRIRAAVEIGGEEFGYITADIFIFDKIAVGIYPNPAIIRNNNIPTLFAHSPVKLSSLTMHIFDIHGNIVKKLSGIKPNDPNGDFTESITMLNEGSYEYVCETWDFRNKSGNLINTGIYIIVAEGKSSALPNSILIRDSVPFYFRK